MLDDTASALAALRGKTFALREAVEGEPIAGMTEVLEAPAAWEHPPPEFILNLSGIDIPDWIGVHHELHGSYLCQHIEALVFAQNSTFDIQAGWGCESHAFRTQFIDSFQSPAYLKFFPGPKPSMVRSDVGWDVSFDNLVDTQVQRIDEPVFLATPLEPNNWGRWVSSVIPKATLFQRMGPGRKFFCYMEHQWQRAMLNDLGISDDRLLKHDPGCTYLCADLATVRYSATSMTISAEEGRIYRAIAEQSNAPEPHAAGQCVFVSRLSQSIKKPKYRVLENEPEMIAAMRARGFSVIEPELYTFTEQVAIFAGARVVVGLGGAGMFNVVFCKPGTQVVTIESSPRFLPPHSRLFASAGHRYGIIVGKESADDLKPAHRRWSLDVPTAVDAIDRFVA